MLPNTHFSFTVFANYKSCKVYSVCKLKDVFFLLRDMLFLQNGNLRVVRGADTSLWYIQQLSGPDLHVYEYNSRIRGGFKTHTRCIQNQIEKLPVAKLWCLWEGFLWRWKFPLSKMRLRDEANFVVGMRIKGLNTGKHWSLDRVVFWPFLEKR